MLEYAVSHITVTDVAVMACAALAWYVYQMNLLQPVIIKCTPNERFYTVIQNKWESMASSDKLARPSALISIRAITYPVSACANPIDFPTMKPRFPEETKKSKNKENSDIAAKIQNLRDTIDNLDDDIKSQLLREELEDELEDLINGHTETPYQTTNGIPIGSHTKRTNIPYKKEIHVERIQRYDIVFHFPYFVQWQMNNLVDKLTLVNLSNAEKDDLLVKLYWEHEERKLY